MPLPNPYLDFFLALPAWCRRDPALPPSAAELLWPEWLVLKSAIVRHFAWAVPTDEAITLIRDHAMSVVEIGAGSGYWAWLMRQAGVEVAPYDVAVPAHTWTPVAPGDESAIDRHPDSTLLLCWPPWGSDMAFKALTRYRGERFIYVGEWMAGNAEARFFGALASEFEAVDLVPIPQWYARDDRLYVFRRRTRVS